MNNNPQQRAILNRGFINTSSGMKEIVIVPSSQIQLQTTVSSTNSVPAGPTVISETSIYNTNGFSTNFQNEPRASVAKLTFNHPRLSGSYISPTVISGSMKRHPPLQYDLLQSNNNSSNVRKMTRSTDKSKGLRHFSTKVCEKVREKGVTNYNEVADELVQEYFESSAIDSNNNQEKQLYDQKNIRRRVYDALNVLMAMNIITKEKKEIKWVGLPTSTVQEKQKLEEEKAKIQERIKQKAELLQDSIIQLVATKGLIERNKMMESAQGRPPHHTILSLPFVVVTTDKKTEVDCSISPDKSEYLFKFNQPFEIYEDTDVLKMLGMAYGLDTKSMVDKRDLTKIKTFLPPAVREYVDDIADGTFISRFLTTPYSQAKQQDSIIQNNNNQQQQLLVRNPAVKSLAAQGVPRTSPFRSMPYDERNSRSMDAADLEVAMTLAPDDNGHAPAPVPARYIFGNGAGTADSQRAVFTPSPLLDLSSNAEHPYGRHSAQQHHAFFAAAAAVAEQIVVVDQDLAPAPPAHFNEVVVGSSGLPLLDESCSSVENFVNSRS